MPNWWYQRQDASTSVQFYKIYELIFNKIPPPENTTAVYGLTVMV